MNVETETFLSCWNILDAKDAFDMQADPIRQFKTGIFIVKYKISNFGGELNCLQQEILPKHIDLEDYIIEEDRYSKHIISVRSKILGAVNVDAS